MDYADNDIKLLLAKNPKAPKFIIETFLKSSDNSIRCAAEQNPNRPKFIMGQEIPQILPTSAFDFEYKTAKMSTNLNMLEKLASHKDPNIREALASNPKISPSISEILADDEDRIKVALLNNPSVSPNIKKRFETDTCKNVREAALQRQKPLLERFNFWKK